MAVPRTAYTKRKPNEFSFEESETMRILASQAFIKDVRESRALYLMPSRVWYLFLGAITHGPIPFHLGLLAGAKGAARGLRSRALRQGRGSRARVWQHARHG